MKITTPTSLTLAIDQMLMSWEAQVIDAEVLARMLGNVRSNPLEVKDGNLRS